MCIRDRVTAFLDRDAASIEPVAAIITIAPTRQSKGDSHSGVVVQGASDVLVKLAKCCTPVPGDQILGFVTRGSGVSAHRSDCTNVQSLLNDRERIIDVEWAPTTKSVFLVQIQVEALDRSGLLLSLIHI